MQRNKLIKHENQNFKPRLCFQTNTNEDHRCGRKFWFSCLISHFNYFVLFISVLALLDFSSAFDTIDHPILVHRLHTDFGFTDTVLQWFSSYLTDRTHYVSLSNHWSAFTHVHSGVPQGSVLGPILFTMYIKPLYAIIDSHSIIHHSFADDLQLQMSAPPDRISELLHSMQSCISEHA